MNQFDTKSSIDQEHVSDNAAMTEQKKNSAPKPTSTLFNVIVISVLCIAAIFLLFALFVHPIDWLRFRMAVVQNYEITISSPYGSFDKYESMTIQVSKNLIHVEESVFGPERYYAIEGNTAYEYRQYSDGHWEKIKTDLDSLFNADGEETFDFNVLLYGKNYNKNGIISQNYDLKSSVDIGDYRSVKFSKGNGKNEFQIFTTIPTQTGTSVMYSIKVNINHIGTTRIDQPWK